MSDYTDENPIIQFIQTDSDLLRLFQEQDAAKLKFPPSEEGASHYLEEMLGGIDINIKDLCPEGELDESGKFRYDLYLFGDQLAKFHPDKLFRIGSVNLAPVNKRTGDPDLDFYDRLNLPELRKQLLEFMKNVYPYSYSWSTSSAYDATSGAATIGMPNLSVNYLTYPPDPGNYEIVKIVLSSAYDKRLFEEVMFVVNIEDPSRLRGIYYTSEYDFETGVPTPFMFAININGIYNNSPAMATICRPVTRLEEFGARLGNFNLMNRLTNTNYVTIGCARARKILGLFNYT